MYILLKEDGTYWAMFDTIERAVKEFAFISGVDVEEDWECWENALGWGWIDESEGFEEYGIFRLEDC